MLSFQVKDLFKHVKYNAATSKSKNFKLFLAKCSTLQASVPFSYCKEILYVFLSGDLWIIRGSMFS